MKFTYTWLLDHLETTCEANQITNKLTDIGLEVEDFHNPASVLKDFTVAEIVSAEQHPNADRLKVCKVFDGKETLQIVCGAPNARSGIKVVLAHPGAVIPITGTTLSKGVIRGVESCGMMCSTRELQLGDDHEGIIELPATAQVGQRFVDVMGLDDPVFEINVTPNRGDCLSVYGIARDLSAAGIGKLKPLNIPEIPGTFTADLKIERQVEENLCPIFAARVFRGLKNGQSPQWLQNRLRAIGVSIISSFVDISNYLLFDLGRPSHMFNAAAVKGRLTIRNAKEGEAFLALKEVPYTLDSSMVVIADEKEALSLAGIKGAHSSGCYEETSDVIFESALFDPVNIAQTGRKLNLHSDARARFERGVDAALIIPSVHYATRLLLDVCGGEASQVIVSGQVGKAKTKVSMPTSKVFDVTGVNITQQQSIKILEDLGFQVSCNNAIIEAEVPTWRHDIEFAEDLVEEVIRIVGYDQLPLSPLPAQTFKPVTRSISYGSELIALKKTIVARGYHELQTWSFISTNHARDFGGELETLTLINPISAELCHMRTSLLPNILLAMQKNLHRGVDAQAFFEVGTQFRGIKPDEQDLAFAGVCVGALVPKDWNHQSPTTANVFTAKADLWSLLKEWGMDPDRLMLSQNVPSYYHPQRSGALHLGPKVVVGYFGEIHPRIAAQFDLKKRVAIFELNISKLPSAKKPASKDYKPSDYQSVQRDFAFVVEQSVKASALLQTIAKVDKNLIRDVQLFDVYQGEKVVQGHKSLAIRIEIQADDRTLTDQELQDLSSAVIKAVHDQHKGQLRQ